MVILRKKNGNKYLIFDDSVNENKELLKNMQMFGMELKKKIKEIKGGKENDYEKDYVKITFNSCH